MSVLDIDDIEEPGLLRNKRGQRKGALTRLTKQANVYLALPLNELNVLQVIQLKANISNQQTEFELFQNKLISVMEVSTDERGMDKEWEELHEQTEGSAKLVVRLTTLEDSLRVAEEADTSVRLLEDFLQSQSDSLTDGTGVPDEDLKDGQEQLRAVERLVAKLSVKGREIHVPRVKEMRRSFNLIRSAVDAARPPVDPAAVAVSATPTMTGFTPADFMRSRLPDITFPKFSGEKKDWPLFWTEFTQLIAKDKLMTEQDKLTYLRRAVTTPTALAEYRHLTGRAGDYDYMSRVLLERYHDPRLLYREAVESTINSKSIDESEAREWALTIESAIRHVNASGHNSSDDVFAAVGELKLSGNLSKQWTKRVNRSLKPTKAADLLEFLREQAIQYETNQETKQRTRAHNKQAEHQVQKPKKQPAYYTQTEFTPPSASAPSYAPQQPRGKPPCKLCKVVRHPMAVCPDFLKSSVQQRKEVIKRLKLCVNCLGYGHQLETCRSTKTCRECNHQHHSMLHVAEATMPTTPPVAAAATQPAQNHTAYLANADQDIGILPTAIVTIEANGTTVQARAILDVCSTASYVTSRLVQRLGASTKTQPISTNTVGNLPGLQCELVANLTIRPKRQHLSNAIHINAHVSKSVSMILPTDPLPDAANLPFLSGLDLADPSFHLPGRVDLLLGSEATARMSHVGQTEARASQDGRFLAADTIYGWIIQGGATTQQAGVYLGQITHNPSVFWETEEIQSHQKSLTKDETDAVEHFDQTHSRDTEGRYIVSLPRKLPTPELGHSRSQAERRFDQNQRTLTKKGKWEPFKAAVAEYGHLGHAEPVPVADLSKPDHSCYYLPMHGVSKDSSTTTKLRIVFDASARTSNGMSLNDTLLAGPNQYPLTTQILLKFRRHNIGMTADISKMFREIGLNQEDRDLHRFIWKDEHGQSQVWRMKRVTFGVTSSPFLATQTLLQLASDHEKQHPEAAQVIRQEFYVDDCLTGASTIQEAVLKRQQLNDLLLKGKMNLRKWRSNSTELQLTIPTDLCEEEEDIALLTPDRCHKILGIHWDTHADQMFVSTPDLEEGRKATKRQISSDLARTYDVLGWFAPAMVIAKLLLQEIWVKGLDWDEEIPETITAQWRQWTDELPLINAHPIPRCYYQVFKRCLSVQLHGFSDASERAYGGVIYLRSFYEDATTSISLVTAKTKVSPTTPITVPKLELCGALLLSKLMEDTRKSLGIEANQLFAWTDSTIVLAWLNQEPGKLKVYVSNRVSTITNRVPASSWRHVPTEDNPADLASRGAMPRDLTNNQLWWSGPQWLSQDPSTWPKRTFNKTVKVLELKKAFTALSTQQTISSSLSSRYSSFRRLVRISAWHLRFVMNARQKDASLRCLESRLSAGELDGAEKHLFKSVQQQHYHIELAALHLKKELPPKSTLSHLHPILSKDGLLILGGRLAESDLPEVSKHPIILPKKSRLTHLIVAQHHLDSHHAGASILLGLLAQRFHISGARSLIRRVTERCVPCRKAYARKSIQLMGQLPAQRITASPTFSHVGVDLAGPMMLKSGNPRKPRIEKAYICLFVCMATKAIHLEVVSDLSTEAFMATFQRFVSRRGLPTTVYSDNGTNFVGADRSLRQAYDSLHSQETTDQLHGYLANHKVTWSHIPELAPHFGGLWESNIKSTKTLLRSIAGTTPLTFERLTTFLCQAEAILNSRPLVPLNAQSPDSELALTPGHFLVGRPLTAVPDITNVLGLGNQISRAKWNHCRQLSEHFWKQWSTSYITSLNRINRWKQPQRNVRVGDVVLVKDKFLFVNQWPLARVIQVHPGSDGLVRTATVRGPSCGTHKRPIVKLVILIPEEEDVSFSPPEDGRACDGSDVQ